ncbi:MAG: hypothetical protein Q4E24_13465 [bacterium]|nr:hypothetical protein [bacterium]
MALFEFPRNPTYTENIRRLEPTDRAHASIFNTIFEKLIGNIAFLRKQIEERVIIGTEDTELEVGTTLFIVDELPEKKPFEGAAFTNLVFQEITPDGRVENWADTSSAEMMMLSGSGEENKNIISGKLTVADEAAPGTVFFAKINK